VLIEDPRVPEKTRILRKQILDAHPEQLHRQVVETIARLEMRTAGIKSSIINDLFGRVPLDGMLWWINEAHKRCAGKRGGYIVAMLNRTGGAYKGRQKGAP
jgi:hypothetical protein